MHQKENVIIKEGKLKCLALACSPRQNGNTSFLAQQALAGCKEAGACTELIYLTDYHYAPCQACNGCYKGGKCILKDDAELIFNKILSADRFIIAAPIFSMGICAQAKMLIDRAQQFWAAKYILKRPGIHDSEQYSPRQGIFISCAGTNLPGVFDGAVQVVKYFLKMLEIKLSGIYCYSGVDDKGEIKINTAALQEVYLAGKKLVTD